MFPIFNMPIILTAIALIVISVAIVIAGLWLLRPFLTRQKTAREEAIISYLFNGVGLIYAVVLAFVVFAVWERYSNVQQTVTNEAASLVVAFRDTQNLPEDTKKESQEDFRKYTIFVMEKEWKSHGTVIQHKTPDPLNNIWKSYRTSELAFPYMQNELATAKDSLRALENQRHLRHLASEASLPTVFWPLLIGGGVITIVFSYFFSMKDFVSQSLLTALFTIIIAGTLLLIFSLNYPFTGLVQVSKNPFRHALLQFDALNLSP